ncbi:MAG: hypothetical protein ACK4ND_08385 [Cytophagaceae bacterium]
MKKIIFSILFSAVIAFGSIASATIINEEPSISLTDKDKDKDKKKKCCKAEGEKKCADKKDCAKKSKKECSTEGQTEKKGCCSKKTN